MLSSTPSRSFRTALAMAALPLLLMASIRPASAQPEPVTWDWSSPGGGVATNPINWWNGVSTGLPAPLDRARFLLPGAYPVTWASPVDSLIDLSLQAGRVRFNVGSSLGMSSYAFANSDSFTVLSGRIKASNWYLGQGRATSMLVSGSTTLVESRDSTQADHFGDSGNANLRMVGGAAYRSNGWVVMAGAATDVCTTTAIGGKFVDQVWSNLTTRSSLGGGNRGSLIVGQQGTGVLQLQNGGYADIAGDLVAANSPSAIGTVHVFNSPAGIGTPYLTVHGRTTIGTVVPNNIDINVGRLLVEKGYLNLLGPCQVNAGFFQVRNGASLTATSIKVGFTGSSYSNRGWGLSMVGPGTSATISSSLEVGDSPYSSFSAYFAGADSGASITCTGSAPLKVGPTGYLYVYRNSTITASSEIDVRGVVQIDGTVQAPILKLIKVVYGQPTLQGLSGSLRSRLSIPVGTEFYACAYGPFSAGDSTANDGFVSSGTTYLQSSGNLLLLDKDGVDLGNLYLGLGTLRIPSGGFLHSGFTVIGGGRIEGDLTNEGEIILAGGEQLDFAGRLTQRTGKVTGAGILHVLPGASLLARGLIEPEIVLEGSLAFHVSPSRISSAGGIRAPSNATMNFNIGSRSSGRWDTLAVTGTATLDCALALRTGPITFPQLGDTLTIITASSVIGTFRSVTVNGAPGAGQVALLYTPTSVKVVRVGAITGVEPEALRELRLTSIGTLRRPTFAISLAEPSRVRMVAYDVSGREKAVLVDGLLPAGTTDVPVPGTGSPSGILFVRAEISGPSGTRVLRTRALKLR